MLSSAELNAGINRLSVFEHDTLAPLIGNVENQRRFRELIEQIGRRTIQRILRKAFPEQDMAIQDFRRSLAHKLADEKGVGAAKTIMHGNKERTVRLGEDDTATDSDDTNR